jgi:carbohydrate diacid regulator
MILTSSLATEIVEKIGQIICYNINIMNHLGIIIASTNPKRINSYHKGAEEVIKTGKTIEITEEIAKNSQGVQEGVNLPISFNNKIVGVVGITGNPSVVRQYGELVKSMVELMLQQTFLTEQITLERNARERFIYDLIHGNFHNTDEEQAILRGKIYGYDLTLPRLCIVFNVNAFKNSLKQWDEKNPDDSKAFFQSLNDTIPNFINNYFRQKKQDIFLSLGNGDFVILMALKDVKKIRDEVNQIILYCNNIIEKIKESLDIEVNVGIGSCYSSIMDLTKSYHEALKAIKIGRIITQLGIDNYLNKNNVFFYSNLGTYLLIDSLPDEAIEEFMKKYMQIKQNLNALLDPALKETLLKFFECDLNVSRTAREMYIHRNTLIYRLDKIYSLTGRDPRIFSDAVDLKIGLLIDAIRGSG